MGVGVRIHVGKKEKGQTDDGYHREGKYIYGRILENTDRKLTSHHKEAQ